MRTSLLISFRDKGGLLKLMVGALRPVPGNVNTVGLVYVNLQPECELPGSTRFVRFQKFEKNELGALTLGHF